MKTDLKKWLCRAACSLAAFLPLASLADQYFTNKEGNLIWDKASNLVWMRCSLGQEWDGKRCSGSMRKYTLEQAQEAAKQLNARGGYARAKDWAVPNIRQLASLITCSNGVAIRNSTDVKDGGAPISDGCPDGYAWPTIDPIAYPNMSNDMFDARVWSSSPFVDRSGHSWHVNFSGGFFSFADNADSYGVRLVRSSQLLTSEGGLVFRQQLPIPDQRDWAQAKTSNRNQQQQLQQKNNQRNTSNQLCEAQKQSCIANCPPRAEGFRLDSTERNQCVFQCERISCN